MEKVTLTNKKKKYLPYSGIKRNTFDYACKNGIYNVAEKFFDSYRIEFYINDWQNICRDPKAIEFTTRLVTKYNFANIDDVHKMNHYQKYNWMRNHGFDFILVHPDVFKIVLDKIGFLKNGNTECGLLPEYFLMQIKHSLMCEQRYRNEGGDPTNLKFNFVYALDKLGHVLDDLSVRRMLAKDGTDNDLGTFILYHYFGQSKAKWFKDLLFDVMTKEGDYSDKDLSNREGFEKVWNHGLRIFRRKNRDVVKLIKEMKNEGKK
jgi:hypothetical protein